MKLRLPIHLRTSLLALTAVACFYSTSQAGMMLDSIGYELYRNLAENRNGYKAGATDVPLYGAEGQYLGTAAIIPDFAPIVNAGTGAALAGGQNWILDCSHIAGNINSLDFGGGKMPTSAPTHESYRTVKSIDPYYDSQFDIGTLRISKVVTDVVHWEVADDPAYTMGDVSDKTVWRVGLGTNTLYRESDGAFLADYGAYSNAIAGTITFYASDVTKTYMAENGRGEKTEVTVVYRSANALDYPEGRNPADIAPTTTHYGDSGSPFIIYNEDTKSFQYIGACVSGTAPGYVTSVSNIQSSQEWYDYVIESSVHSFQASDSVTIFGADEAGNALIDYGSSQESVRVLLAGQRGDTSTNGVLATNNELWETLDWRFSQSNMIINIADDINTGAGAIQFNRSNSADSSAFYELRDSSDGIANFVTAGYIIQEHASVTSYLTGQLGDEWRIVGENARMNALNQYEIFGGEFTLSGSGNNDVDLNLGVGVTVHLNRDGGYAARDVQINTGAKVVLADANQIAGTVLFGSQGGTLDLNGNDYARTSENLYVFNEDATIGNFANGTNVSFSYTVTEGNQEQLHAAFIDTQSLGLGQSAQLSLNIDSLASSSQSVKLDNTISIAGDINISGTHVTLSGRQVAMADMSNNNINDDYVPVYSDDKWDRVNMHMDSLNVGAGGELTLASHVSVFANQLNVAASSNLTVQNHAHFEGHIELHGNATIQGGSQLTGSMDVNNGGVLNLQGNALHDINLSIAQGGQAEISGKISIQGLITNAGNLHIEGELGLSQSIQNTGTLTFDESSSFNLSEMTSSVVDGLTTYQIFEGGNILDFASFNSNDVYGNGAQNHVWDFHADGRISMVNITSVYALNSTSIYLHGSTLGFENGEAITTTGESRIDLVQNQLSTQRLYVSSGELELISNGNELYAERLLLGDGASLIVVGKALDSQTRIIQENGTQNTHVTLNLLGETLAENTHDWLLNYTGNLSIENGSFALNEGDYAYRSLFLAENAQLNIHDVETIAAQVSGLGTIDTGSTQNVTFENLQNFSGHISSTATSVTFETGTAASMLIGENTTLYLDGIGEYTGAYTGTGNIATQGAGEIELHQLSNFQGTLTAGLDSHTILHGDVHQLSGLNYKNYAILELAAGAQVTTQSIGNTWFKRATIILGEGASLNQRNQQYLIAQGESEILGNGDIYWGGITLSADRAISGLVVDTGITLHITGTKHSYGTDLSNQGSFQLSHTDASNTLKIYGSVISNAAISSGNGNYTITVYDGGSLELKAGPAVSNRKATNNNLWVESGGTLLLGQQSTTHDWGNPYSANRLTIRMNAGGRLGGSGTGDITIYHALQVFENEALHLLTQEGQNLIMQNMLYSMHMSTTAYAAPAKNIHAHVSGDGQLTFNNTSYYNQLHISEAPEIHFTQSRLNLEKIVVEGQAQLFGNNTQMIVESLALSGSAGQSQLQVGAGIENIAIGSSASSISRHGDLTIATRGAEPATMNAAQWSHVNVSNAVVNGFSSTALNNVALNNTQINASNLHVATGSNAISNSSIDAQSTLSVGAGASLSMSNSSLLGDFTIAAGGEVSLLGNNTMSGSITNAGLFNISGQLSLTQGIVNSGNLIFADSVILDLSQIVGEVTADGTVYRIFSGVSSDSFTLLGLDNLTGLDDLANAQLNWTFQSDGSILSAMESVIITDLHYHGGNLNLVQNVGGFEGGASFTNGASIQFSSAPSTLRLDEANLHVADLLVDATSLSIESNGNQLAVDNLNLTAGASLEIIGEALAADVVIGQVDGTRDTQVILDMQGGVIADKNWLDSYTGDLRLRDGKLDMGNTALGYQSLHLEADSSISMSNASPVTTSISGAGRIELQQIELAELRALNGFTGSIDSSASTLRLGGTADDIIINRAANSSLEILAGADISARTTLGYRWATNYSINVGEGAHFDERTTQLRINGGTVNLSGSGLYTIRGMALSASNQATTVNIDAGLTVHIVGTSNNNLPSADGSLQVSTWNKTNTLNIAGSLISEAGISSRDGNANINILDGGLLELKVGPRFNYNTARASTINVNDGGTLALGNQSDSTNYGDQSRAGRLDIRLHDGATLTTSGTEDVTIHHSLLSSNQANVNIATKAGQQLHINSALGDMHVHATGEGSLHLHNTGAAKNITVSTAALELSQQHVQLDSLQLSNAQASVNLNSVESLSVGSTEMRHHNGSQMNIAYKGGGTASISQSSMSNVSISNTHLSGAQNVGMSNVSLNNSYITQSTLQVNSGSTLVSNSIIGEGSEFILTAGSQLEIINSHFESYSDSTFQLADALNVDMKDYLTLRNVSMDAQVNISSSNFGTMAVSNYQIAGVESLVDQATIEGKLYMDMSGLADLSLTDNMFLISFDSVIGSYEDIFNQLVFRSGDLQLDLNKGVDMRDGSYLFFSSRIENTGGVAQAAFSVTSAAQASYSIIPEPSTATLSLLALGGLLLRRRRKAS